MCPNRNAVRRDAGTVECRDDFCHGLLRIEGGPILAKGRWHALRLSWDLDCGRCSVEVDGKPALVLPRLKYDSDPLSYLRLRSDAKSPDPAGMLIERVAATRNE